MTTTYDVKRELRACYAPKNSDWDLVDVPDLRFLAVDGRGDPNTSAAYRHAVEALHAVAYTAKFASKGDLGKDFVVSPLEGLWWADDFDDFRARRKDNWRWRPLLHVPGWITDGMVEDARRTALAKKKAAAIADVVTTTLREGRCAQALHVGSYDDEAPAPARLHDDYLPAHHLREAGPHHEICPNDPRRTAPDKLRTILRQPVTAQPT